MGAPRGGVHLPIAHTLRLPEPTKKNKSEGCVPLLCSSLLAALNFGSTWKERKKKKERKNNNAKFSGHYVRPRTHNVRSHALRSHQFHAMLICIYVRPLYFFIYTTSSELFMVLSCQGVCIVVASSFTLSVHYIALLSIQKKA